MFKVKIHPNFLKFFLLIFLAIFVVGKTAAIIHSSFHYYQALAGDKSSPNNDLEKCQICSFLVNQNQITLVADLVIAATIFHFLILARKFNRVKLSYFLSSNYSRAPPAFS